MSWRLAQSLITLRNQLNSAYPNRSKIHDGTIGDAAHQSSGSASDHNPWVGPGVVTAMDITDDPANGVDVLVIANNIALSRDRRLKYLIYTGGVGGRPGILSSTISPWTWRVRAYDDHPHHLHISVSTVASLYDSVAPWKLTGGVVRPPAAPPYPGRLALGSSGAGVSVLQRRLKALGYIVTVDARYGPQTTSAVRAYQRHKRLVVDGIVGPVTWHSLWA